MFGLASSEFLFMFISDMHLILSYVDQYCNKWWLDITSSAYVYCLKHVDKLKFCSCKGK